MANASEASCTGKGVNSSSLVGKKHEAKKNSTYQKRHTQKLRVNAVMSILRTTLPFGLDARVWVQHQFPLIDVGGRVGRESEKSWGKA